MEDQVTAEQSYGVMIDQGYMTEQVSLPVADGSVEAPPLEVPQTMDVSVTALDAPSMMDASALAERQLDGSNSSTVPVDDSADVQTQLEEPTVLTEEDRLWNVVKTNPADFSAWTSLIQEVDKLVKR